jgi:hypothetical protein
MLMKKTFIHAVLVFIALAGFAVLLTRHSRGNPRIQIPSMPVELGDGKPGEVLGGNFKIKNVGGGVLRYTITPSCGCTELKPESALVEPWGSNDIKVAVKLAGIGEEKTVRLSIDSNDPEFPNTSVFVKANCPAAATSTPATVEFGANTPDELSSREVVVKVLDREMKTQLDKLVITTTNNVFSINKYETDKKNNEIKIYISFNKQLIPGLYPGSIHIATESGMTIIDVPLSANVTEEIAIVPKTVVVRTTGKIDSEIPIRIMIKKSGPSSLGNVRSAEAAWAHDITVRKISEISDHITSCELSIRSKDLAGGLIKLYFSNTEKTAQFNVAFSKE